MERFRVEGVDDTFYGIFLTLYSTHLLADMQLAVRLGFGLTALYLTLVNMNGIKQMIMSIHALFKYSKLKYFFHSLGS